MLYIQQFQRNRQAYLRQYQRAHLLDGQSCLLCSNAYSEKFPKISRPATSNNTYSRNQASFMLSGILSSDKAGYNNLFFRK